MKTKQIVPWLCAAAISMLWPATAQGPLGDTIPAGPGSPLLWLALAVLCAVVVIVFWQMFRVAKAKRLHRLSTLSRGESKIDTNPR